jgi:hypothetical protein
MRIDSCRKCGAEMESKIDADVECQICNSATKFVCTNCESETEVQYHVHHTEKMGKKLLTIIPITR